MRRVGSIALALAAAAVLAGCGGSDSEDGEEAAIPGGADPAAARVIEE